MKETSILLQLSVDDLKDLITSSVNEAVCRLSITQEHSIHQPSESEIISREEAKKILGVSTTTLHNWNVDGVLPARHLNRKVYYFRKDILAKLGV